MTLPVIDSGGQLASGRYRCVLDERVTLRGVNPFPGTVASPVALLRRAAVEANITAMQR